MVPFFLRTARGFQQAKDAAESWAQAKELPPIFNGVQLNTDYRIITHKPNGLPFSIPFTVIYKPESPDEIRSDLTFRARLR